MTTTETLPHTPTITKTMITYGLTGADKVWTLGEEIAYRLARAGFRWPFQAAGTLAVLPALPAVSWNTITGGVLAASGLLVLRAGMRARIPSLLDLSSSRARRARIQAEWPRVCADNGLVKPGKDKSTPRVPKIVSIRDTTVGHRITVSGAHVSMSTDAFVSKAQSVRTGLGARDISIRSRDNLTDIDLMYRDTLARVIRARDMSTPSRDTLIVSGVDSWGQPVEESPYANQLLVGEAGSGKSSKIWRLIQALQEAGIPHRVRAFDPKEGVEFGEMEGAAYMYESDPRGLSEFLSRCFRSHAARAADMRSKGVKRLMTATEDNPLDILIIDELLTALKMNAGKAGSKVRIKDTSMDVSDALIQYLSVGAATLHFVWACSQLGQKNTLGDLADMFPAKTLLRVPSDDMARIVFDDAKSYPAHKIPRGAAGNGIGYTFTEAAGIVKYRAALLTDAERRQVVKRMAADTAKWRERWPL